MEAAGDYKERSQEGSIKAGEKVFTRNRWPGIHSA
jgi:hypothetical protein